MEGLVDVQAIQTADKTHADGEEGDGLVDTSEWGNIDGLSSDGTLGSDSGRVFSWASVDNGVDEDLDWVLLGDEVDDLESVLDDSDGHDLFTVVSSVHHEAGCELAGYSKPVLTRPLTR